MQQERKQEQKQEQEYTAGTAASPPPPPPRAGAGKLAHQPFQEAHDEYFKALNEAWNATPRRLHDLQVEMQRELERAWDEKAPQAVQDAAARYQEEALRLMQDAWPSDRFHDAYKRYKGAMQRALAASKPDDLDMMTLYNICQSLLVVGQTAAQLDPYRLAPQAQAQSSAR